MAPRGEQGEVLAPWAPAGHLDHFSPQGSVYRHFLCGFESLAGGNV